ncbi:MAG: sigma-70 family RNA polymerase sigma factor [Microscillaceae bacterium]|nr:sigma-70 family RNA polymerase sigma factor [Microscillaceae bacterium]
MTQENSYIEQTIEHLFRRESGRIIALLTRIFGTHNLELAEDVVQDTLLKALEHWKFKGVPQNPSAWILQVAKNQALDVIRREKLKNKFADEVHHLLQSEYSLLPTLNQLWQETELPDDQLRMMFACCHPSLPAEAQIALILKTLCGFNIAEIARAFVSNEETISKRLYRAKQVFREQKIKFEIPDNQQISSRLGNVLEAIYLLFNEGYNTTHHDTLIRQDLLEESLRLGKMLADNPRTCTGEVCALLALMCFHTARIPARTSESGSILLLQFQNRALWNRELIAIGLQYLDQAAQSQHISPYHIEAGIAYEHCLAPTYAQTHWERIIILYDLLYQIQASPVVALNRAIALAELKGAQAGLDAIAQITDLASLKKFYLLPATLGELYAQLNQPDLARFHWQEAWQLTQSPHEKQLLTEKINELRLDDL